jgi:hypothetical protein
VAIGHTDSGQQDQQQQQAVMTPVTVIHLHVSVVWEGGRPHASRFSTHCVCLHTCVSRNSSRFQCCPKAAHFCCAASTQAAPDVRPPAEVSGVTAVPPERSAGEQHHLQQQAVMVPPDAGPHPHVSVVFEYASYIMLDCAVWITTSGHVRPLPTCASRF